MYLLMKECFNDVVSVLSGNVVWGSLKEVYFRNWTSFPSLSQIEKSSTIDLKWQTSLEQKSNSCRRLFHPHRILICKERIIKPVQKDSIIFPTQGSAITVQQSRCTCLQPHSSPSQTACKLRASLHWLNTGILLPLISLLSHVCPLMANLSV